MERSSGKFYSATLNGVQPVPVEIEVDLSPGLPFFQIVGLPDEVLKESKTRVKSAIVQAGYDFPYDSRLVLNLAPSRLKKEGSGFELGLAAQILHASGQITVPFFDILYLGELALDGTVKPVDDIEALALSSESASGVKLIVVPEGSEKNLKHCNAVGIKHLRDLLQPDWWKVYQNKMPSLDLVQGEPVQPYFKEFSFSDFWVWHLQLATVGNLNYFICGPPGCGKTFFAESVRSLKEIFKLVPKDPLLETLDHLFKRSAKELPWASPHHTTTQLGLVGGGRPPRPGAVTKAHGGILFLDELLEFDAASLDSLREPFEKGSVEVSRAGYNVTFPSRFQLIAATNPCRCGFWNHSFQGCDCSRAQRKRYQSRLSGPLLDRFDIKISCKPPQGNESKISGSLVLKKMKEILKFVEQETPAWSADAEEFLRYEFGYRIKSHRTLEKLKKVAPMIAAVDLKSTIDLSDVQKALSLQEFSFD